MIEVISKRLARKIKDGYPGGNIDVMAYEIGRVLNHYGIIAFTCLIGWLSGEFFKSLLAMFSFALIRRFSGGLHLNLTTCTIVSVTLFCTVPFIQLDAEISLLLNTLSTLLFLFFSPNSYGWMSKDLAWKRKSKIISVLIVSSNFFINSTILSLIFITQGLLILPLKGGESR
ncbi:accessory gene regulator B family protein [Paenibacillus larvae subsp. larvae]|uniref:accessory gene regulator B family protein n=1 Tax=Paenibacillus larvae TaxID=1464 RepID=UPI0023A951A8|nr:accessory gene regulator B family protein [Paenibacillus larvae]MDE5126186.1 accessory gene regulator B family protein [Paenibacillus larvae subsp. larvae]MDE5133221.1 accessory gene regulator B family protein [Paenibacillus larvae subsp. larvae]MDE5137362.1 accessory gene regulator B family protein [Paenibacillus larvae subsp. larvae]MDE5142053.1 accessory gene regulator B family protein [Paenibacillus larvae subsp. larvae]MDE5149799.1 accessory gene regulator B family protein [Paenibacill